MNSFVAAAVAEHFAQFQQIRTARSEVDPAKAVSQETYDSLVSAVKSLTEPRVYTRASFDGWFSAVCSSNGHTKTAAGERKELHIRIPAMDHKARKEFADVLWIWITCLRSKYIKINWT